MELFFFQGIFLTTCSIIAPASGQLFNQSIKLMSDMLIGYDSRHRPTQDQSKPIHVNVSFDLVAIQDFDEVEQRLSTIGVLYLTWYDEQIKWEPAAYGGILSQMYRSTDVWYPRLLLTNPYETVIMVGEDWMELRIYNNGLVFFLPGAVFKSSCDVDVTYYPFDTQTCRLSFSPWGYSSKEILLNISTSKIYCTHFTENGEWNITNAHATYEFSTNSNWVTFTFELKRKSTFLLVNFLLPIIFMSVIINFAFVLLPESGERVSYTITVLLAIAVFFTLIGDSLPKKSQPMALVCWLLLMMLAISTMACLFAILNVSLFFKKNETPVPPWCITLIRVVKCGNVKKIKQTLNNKACKATNDVLAHVGIEEMTVELDKTHGLVNEADNEKSSRNEKKNEAEDLRLDSDNVTWQDVSLMLDRICMTTFLATDVACICAFLIILVTNA